MINTNFKRKIILSSISFLALTVTDISCFAQEKKPFFVTLSGGVGTYNKYVVQDSEYDLVDDNKSKKLLLDFGVGIGKKITDNISLSFNFDKIEDSNSKYYHEDSDNLICQSYTKFSNKIYSLNLRYDFNINYPIKPFVSVGLGFSDNHVYFSRFIDDLNHDILMKNRSFAQLLSFGIVDKINDHLDLELSARYILIKDIKYDQDNVLKSQNVKQILLTVRYYF